ncbi:MAG: DNA polymerase [Pyrobaculum sp.]
MYIIGSKPPLPSERVDLIPLVKASYYYKESNASVWRVETPWPPDVLRAKLIARGYRVSQSFVPPAVRRYLEGVEAAKVDGVMAAVYIEKRVVYWALEDEVGRGCPDVDYVATWRQKTPCRGLHIDLTFFYRRPLWVEAAERLGDGVLLRPRSPVEIVKVIYTLAREALDFLKALASVTKIGVDALVEILKRNSLAAVAEAVFHWEAERRGYVLEDSRRIFNMPYIDMARGRAPGVYRDVAEFDFKSLFPTIVVKYEIDPTTARPCRGGLEARPLGEFCFEGGPVADVIKKWLEARLSINKKPMSDVLKLLMNAAVGAWGKAGWGIVCEPCLLAVRSRAAEIFHEAWRTLRPIYGDTDSFYLEAKKTPEVASWAEGLEGFVLELRNIWDVFVLAPAKSGGVAEKNYIKISRERVEVKGGLLKPHDLPLAVRLRYVEIIQRRDPLGAAVEILKQAPPSQLFIHKAVERSRLREIKKHRALHIAAVYFLKKCGGCDEIDVYFVPGDGVVFVPWVVLDRSLKSRPAGVGEVRQAAVEYVSRLWKLKALRSLAGIYIY